MQIDPAIVIAVVTGLISLGTAVIVFRGGMPAAADDMATGFRTLNAELRAELDRLNARHQKELEEQANLIEKLRNEYEKKITELESRLDVMETSERYLRQEVARSDARALYYRNGAFALWHQINDLNARQVVRYEIDPVFDPRINKYPPIKPDGKFGTGPEADSAGS